MEIAVNNPPNVANEIDIVTPRLIMRPITRQEWPLFQQLHNDPNVISLCFDKPDDNQLRDKFAQKLVPWVVNQNLWLCLTIQERETGEWVGITGFLDGQGVAEVGYLLLTEQHGKGYGTESLRAVIEWAQREYDIQQYRAIVTQGNVGSERVLEKCGFTLERIDPLAYEIGGKRYDDHIYTLPT